MKEISIQQLQQDTNQWVKVAAKQETVIITDNGKPVAELIAYETKSSSKGLPVREEKIGLRSVIDADSAEYISEMRN